MIARPLTGARVVYRPHPDAPAEHGTVTGHSANPNLVFVRYDNQHDDAPGKSTSIADLQPGPVLTCDHTDVGGTGIEWRCARPAHAHDRPDYHVMHPRYPARSGGDPSTVDR